MVGVLKVLYFVMFGYFLGYLGMENGIDFRFLVLVYRFRFSSEFYLFI